MLHMNIMTLAEIILVQILRAETRWRTLRRTNTDVCFQDVFIVDTKKEVFVWIGGEASIDERRNGLTYAHVS